MRETGQLAVYRGCSPVVEARLDPGSDGPIMTRLIEAIAEAEGVATTELPSLHDRIDLDALSQLFERHDGADDAQAILGFTFKNWNVFVRADGRILVADGTKPTPPEPVFEGSIA